MGSWSRHDVAGTLQVLDLWWDLLVADVPSAALSAAPGPGEPSVEELRAACVARLLDAGEPELAGLQEVLEGALADLSAAGRVLARLGAGAPQMEGTVASVNRSAGGVPKDPVPGAAVTQRGLEGDRQADRRHHGRVWQALCLWSADLIDELAEEGHPIAPGRAGENLTLAGLDWERIRPGTRIRVGTAMVEVSLPATPCAKNARWFTGGDFMRMSHDRHPGWSRWYASVLTAGEVAAGDAAVVEPAEVAAADRPTP